MADKAPNEKAVKAQVKKLLDLYAKYNPLYVLNPMTFGYGESGHPDTLVLVGGMLIGVECKKDRNNHHTRPELKAKSNEVMQKRQAQKITNAGGVWLCIYNENLHELADVLNTHAEYGERDFNETDHKTYKKLLGI